MVEFKYCIVLKHAKALVKIYNLRVQKAYFHKKSLLTKIVHEFIVKYDVRITFRYKENNLSTSCFMVMLHNHV